MDMNSDRIAPLLENPRLHFFEGDITINREWIEYHVKKCDVVLPLVAIATPATYVREPLRVFELDFEANLAIIRQCVKHRKRVLFPSTSEVYGMCRDSEFDPYASELVYGPIEKPRWIYACSKQLLDRVIHAYGMRDELDYTLFRPFNWIGPGLDNMHAAKEGSSRVITQFLGHIVRGENVRLVDGGQQRRCFTGVSDGIDALMKMIENRDGCASRKIYNIGNPANSLSVRELAQQMLQVAADLSRVPRPTPPRCGWSTPPPPSTTARATRTSRIACRRSTTPAPSWAGPRASRCSEALRQIFEAYRRRDRAGGQTARAERTACAASRRLNRCSLR